MRSLVPWFVVGLAVQALVALGLVLWARWVARRCQTPFWRRAAWLPAVALAINLLGAGGAAALAARVTATPGLLGPEGRVAWRARWAGAGAFGLGGAAVAALLYAASAGLSLAGMLRAPPAAAARGSGSS